MARLILALTLSPLIAALPPGPPFQPNQLHLSFTGETTSLGLDFVTCDIVNCTNTGVALGLSPSALTSFSPSVSCFQLQGVGWQNQALLSGLTPGTRYYYAAGSQTVKNYAWSEVYSFVMPDVAPSAAPLTAAVYADFGWLNAESLPKLVAEAQAGRFDFVVHAGDFAYDMDAYNGEVGTNFMLQIEPYAATMPCKLSARPLSQSITRASVQNPPPPPSPPPPPLPSLLPSHRYDERGQPRGWRELHPVSVARPPQKHQRTPKVSPQARTLTPHPHKP
jgi:hypothetical protein